MGGGWRCSSTGKHDQPLKSGFLLYPSWSQWVPPVTAGALETCVLQPLMQMTRPCHGDLSRFWRRERTMCDGGHSCRSTRPRASEVAVLACAWCGRVPRRLQWGPAGTVTLRVDVLRRAGRGLRSCRPRSDGELSASPSPQSPGVGGSSWKSRRRVSSACVPRPHVGRMSRRAGVSRGPEDGPLQAGRCQRPHAGAGRPGWRPASVHSAQHHPAAMCCDLGVAGAGLTHCPPPRPGGDPAAGSTLPSAVPGGVGPAAQAGVPVFEVGFLSGDGLW